MKECINCKHYEVCLAWQESLTTANWYEDSIANYFEDEDYECEHYKEE